MRNDFSPDDASSKRQFARFASKSLATSAVEPPTQCPKATAGGSLHVWKKKEKEKKKKRKKKKRRRNRREEKRKEEKKRGEGEREKRKEERRKRKEGMNLSARLPQLSASEANDILPTFVCVLAEFFHNSQKEFAKPQTLQN
ncbi:MAG: hypothetical protein ACTS4U_01100 [Candidatus Hodgkinia cicadicola]